MAASHSHDAAIQHCVQELRDWTSKGSFDEDDRLFLTDTTLTRYATARNGDLNAARTNLEETLKWRKANVPKVLHCTVCDKDPHMHSFYPIGIDALGRIVIYACSARAKINDKDVTVAHMVQQLEYCWLQTEHFKLHHQWVWLVDFGGFSMWHAMQGSTSNATLRTFATHFPERLGAIVLINPPGLFDVLLSVVKTVADARTLGKVHILHCTPETVGAGLAPHGIPADSGMAAWMAAMLRLPGKPGSIAPMDVLNQEHIKALTLPRL